MQRMNGPSKYSKFWWSDESTILLQTIRFSYLCNREHKLQETKRRSGKAWSSLRLNTSREYLVYKPREDELNPRQRFPIKIVHSKGNQPWPSTNRSFGTVVIVQEWQLEKYGANITRKHAQVQYPPLERAVIFPLSTARYTRARFYVATCHSTNVTRLSFYIPG